MFKSGVIIFLNGGGHRGAQHTVDIIFAFYFSVSVSIKILEQIHKIIRSRIRDVSDFTFRQYINPFCFIECRFLKIFLCDSNSWLRRIVDRMGTIARHALILVYVGGASDCKIISIVFKLKYLRLKVVSAI